MFDFSPLLSFVNPATYGITFLDLLIMFVVFFYAYEGYSLGFTLAFSDLASFVLSFIVALKLYPFVAKGLIAFFTLPIGFANAIGFFLVALVSEIVLSIVFRRLLHLVQRVQLPDRIRHLVKSFDHAFGFVPGIISAFIVLSFLLTVIVSLPSSPVIKQLVTDSKIGTQLVANTSFFESRLNDIFGGALNETLNFLTVKPQSNETVMLHFSTDAGLVDEQAEEEMVRLVNIERERAGLPHVSFDSALRAVARSHSQDMFARGYFSHYSLEGASPFDRMDKAGIQYFYAGENLALAPSTPLAMQGLMNSRGHRANILNPNFKKLGVGVIDGGIYGKMYSQEFTD